jgi:hypothetical protein
MRQPNSSGAWRTFWSKEESPLPGYPRPETPFPPSPCDYGGAVSSDGPPALLDPSAALFSPHQVVQTILPIGKYREVFRLSNNPTDPLVVNVRNHSILHAFLERPIQEYEHDRHGRGSCV